MGFSKKKKSILYSDNKNNLTCGSYIIGRHVAELTPFINFISSEEIVSGPISNASAALTFKN